MSSRHIRGNLVFKGNYEHTIAGDVTAAMLANMSTLLVNKTSGAATAVALPVMTTYVGMAMIIVDAKGDAGTNNITITPNTGTVNGAATYVISENYGSVCLISDGTNLTAWATGNPISAAELAFLNGVTAGTGLASKALVLDSSGDVTMPDLGSIGFGTVGKISWDPTDANANKLLVQLPTGGGVDVPVIVIGQAVEAVDMGIHNGVTEPTVSILGVGAVATGPVVEFRKARGTATAPTVVTSADDIGQMDAYACVAAGEWVRSAQILFECTGTVATTRGPGVITIKTATDAAPSVLTSALVIGANQVVVPQSGFTPKSLSAAAITTTRTLTVQDSGGIFSVAKTSAYAITLPTPAQGLKFKFMVLDTGANAVTISNGSAHLKGVVSVANASTAMTGTTLSLVATGSIGDWVEFEGIDATTYLVTGACIAAADITIA